MLALVLTLLAADPVFGPEESSGLARAELIAVQALNGGVLAISFCNPYGGFLRNCDLALNVGISVAGIGIGATISAILSRRGIRPAQTLAINTGTAMGWFNGAALMALVDPQLRAPVAWSVVLGCILGTGIGAAIAFAGEPTAGQVSVANSFALWGALGWIATSSALQRSVEVPLSLMVAIPNAFLALGSLLAVKIRASRGRVLIVDAGIATGVFTGWLISELSRPKTIPREPYEQAWMFFGAVAGLGLSIYWSAPYDDPDDAT